MTLIGILKQIVNESYGARAYRDGRLADAESYFRKSWQHAQLSKPTSKSRLRLLEWLTKVTRNQGNFDDAESFGREWVAAAETALGIDNVGAVQALEYLAEVYITIARYHLAQPLLEKALRVREQRRAREPLEYAQALESSGVFLGSMERDADAEIQLRRAFAVVQSLPRPVPEALTIACNLSKVLVHLERLDEAETLAQDAVAAAEKNPRPASLPVAYCLYQLAYVRRFQERFDEAEDHVRRSMAIFRETKPFTEMTINAHLHLLGVILRYQSRWAEAEECFRDVLRLRQEYCAPEDLAIARLLEDYVELLELMGRTDHAHAHERWAKHIRDFHAPFRTV
jgi:tetratricopeptide (TPR) repeat protein